MTGTVADAIGGVAGASVMIDGTSTGTITDLDGKYTIDTKTGDVLVFSCIGYKTVKSGGSADCRRCFRFNPCYAQG